MHPDVRKAHRAPNGRETDRTATADPERKMQGAERFLLQPQRRRRDRRPRRQPDPARPDLRSPPDHPLLHLRGDFLSNREQPAGSDGGVGVMAYLTILAIGGLGLLIAGVSHYFVSRERRAILAAQASNGKTASESESESESVAHNEFVKAAAASVLSSAGKRSGVRLPQMATKQYSKRVGEK